jgi:hypothetical protein
MHSRSIPPTSFGGTATWTGQKLSAMPTGGSPHRTTLVHTDAMAETKKVVRQSVTLSSKIAKEVRSLAKRRRLSANRILAELIEDGIAAQKNKEKAFFELAGRFRAAKDPDEVGKLGEALGKMIFGA